MKNFIIRTITAVFFVAAIVTCFLNPRAMVFLFALVTGMTIWEFTGLVNEHQPSTTVNRMISTVAGVYFFLAMAGYNSGLTPATVFIPYLVSIIYLMIAELYLKQENPINDWAYTMFSQMYIALALHCSTYWHSAPQASTSNTPTWCLSPCSCSSGSTTQGLTSAARFWESTNSSPAYRRERVGKAASAADYL